MTAGGAGSAFTRPTLAPVFAPDGLALAEPPTLRLTEKLHAYDPKADTSVIDAAYAVAAEAHATQRRDNGDPYITHPVAVADILANYRLDTASIATGLLHDVIEDTSVKLPEIQTKFGGEIAGLVDGVTKLTGV
jgi:guanosine-3',5'-bis(diphosphate) 3'-pyrophosphohydrolase